MSWRITARAQISGQQFGLDAAVISALVPVAEILIAKVTRPQLFCEQTDDAVLRAAFATWLLWHEIP